jgi:CubicO group peptidase (beta-lactamase class C family)
MTIALSRSTPEAEGVASSAIETWVDAVRDAGNELHSVMVVRHGSVIVERWWAPYRPEAVHLLYSLSKGFTSTAVGFAVAEGLVGLDDLVLDHFGDAAPAEVGEHLAALRVRHLLSMSAGHAEDSTWTMGASDDWPRSFLAQPFAHEPGTAFLYDSGATFMLSALVQRVTGEPLLHYLRPRLFDPLGVDHVETQTSPDGVATGGWGMSATTETLAAFGLLYLRDGVWNGARVLPEGWVAEATRAHIMLPADFMTGDWQQGYGFQFWRCRHGAYRIDGGFGQFVVVMPDQDAVVAVTSRSPDMQAVLDAIWDVLLPAMGAGPLAEVPASAVTAPALAPTGSTSSAPAPSLPAPQPGAEAPRRHGILEFALEPNDLGYASLAVDIGQDAVMLALGDDRIVCGLGHWVDGETSMPFTPPEVAAAFRPRGPGKLAANGAWTDGDTLTMRWQYYTTPHHDTVTLHFDADAVRVNFLNSITEAAADAYPTLPAGMEEPRPALVGRRVPSS